MTTSEQNVSIICPVRNEEKYISQCLQSLIQQTGKNYKYEILVVDGMSEDTTRDIIKSFIKENNNKIRLLDNKKQFVPFALNIGIRQASGNIIIRVDGHAYVAEDYIEKCLYYLDKTGADCVGGKVESINTNSTGKAIALAMSSRFGVGNSRFRTSAKEGFVDTLAFGAYKKQVFEKVGYFDEQLIRCQDDEFNYRLRKFGGKIYLTPKIKSWYYPRSNFRKLWKQYYGYGFWKIRVLQKHLKMMQIRQFVPAFFVAMIFITGVGSFFTSNFLFLFIGILGCYISAGLYFSLKASLKEHLILFPLILLAYIILHFSYGLGFLAGSIRFLPNWFIKQRKNIT